MSPIISLSQEFDQLHCADPAFLSLPAFQQHFKRLDYISGRMEAEAAAATALAA